MSDTVEQREASMRRVLQHINEKRPLEEFTFEDNRILKECSEAKYFEGLVMAEMISGRVVAEYRFEPRLTYEGLKFLYPDSSNDPQKVEVSLSDSEHQLQAEQQRQERTERKADDKQSRKFDLLNTLLGAFAGAAITLLLEHLGEILNFLHLLLN